MSDARAADVPASRVANALRDAAPVARIESIADVGSVVPRPTLGPSPHVARFGLALRDDDGIVIASAALDGAPVLIAAQDARYLAGSVGERHGHALAAMFDAACKDRVSAIVLLLASGGVRLHEANAAELALARALRSLLDARVAGIPVVAIAVGGVFGGTSVLACAADRFAMLPGSRLGLSGPKVLESVHGAWELDASDTRDVDAVYGAQARQRAGLVELVADDADAIRGWIVRAVRERDDFEASVFATQARLARRVEGDAVQSPAFAALPCFADAAPVDAPRLLWRAPRCWLTRPHSVTTVGPADAHALDAALLANVAVHRPTRLPLVIVEDSAGHTVSRAAEMKLVSHYLAHHASVLALLRAKGTPLVGLLAGTGHSAAFFSNALQAERLYALASARVVAMEPAALARVTGLAAGSLIEDDPLLGQPVRHFAAQGGITAIIDDATLDAMQIA
jgi:malonate decarboxylase beta subunit